VSASRQPSRTPSAADRHPRIAFAVAEVAQMLGQEAAALRKTIERHAVAVGDEMVARLPGGIEARKRNGMARWLVFVPAELRDEGKPRV